MIEGVIKASDTEDIIAIIIDIIRIIRYFFRNGFIILCLLLKINFNKQIVNVIEQIVIIVIDIIISNSVNNKYMEDNKIPL